MNAEVEKLLAMVNLDRSIQAIGDMHPGQWLIAMERALARDAAAKPEDAIERIHDNYRRGNYDATERDYLLSKLAAKPEGGGEANRGMLLSEGGRGCEDCDGYQDEGILCPTCGTDHSEPATPPPSSTALSAVEIANRAQVITGRSIFPSTVEAILSVIGAQPSSTAPEAVGSVESLRRHLESVGAHVDYFRHLDKIAAALTTPAQPAVQPGSAEDAAEAYRVAHEAGEKHGRAMAALEAAGKQPAVQGEREALVPAAKRGPKPDADTGEDRGPVEAHAYADGWNECRAEVLKRIADAAGNGGDRG